MKRKYIILLLVILGVVWIFSPKKNRETWKEKRYTWYARYIKIVHGDSVWYDKAGSSIDTIPPRTYKKDSLWVIEMEGHVLDSDRNRITLDLCKFKEK